MPGRISCPTLVGREGEFQQVTATLEDASGAHPLILIGGEAGIGKSRLLGAILAAQRARGAMVLAGSCIPIAGRTLPFGPIADALRPRHDPSSPPGLADLRRELRSALRLATPHAVAPATDASGQAHVFEAIIEALEHASEQTDLIVSIEDLHWSDAATRDLLAFLVPSRWSGRVSLVATLRSDESTLALRPLLTELERAGQVQRVDLQPLPIDAVRAVVAGITETEPPDAVVEEISRRSGGNPFFVEELVAAAGGGDARLPPNLGEILLARLASLPDPVQQMLRYMAVIGERAPEALLAAVTESDAAALGAQVRAAMEIHVVRPDGPDGYAFRHALVREALYADLLPHERRAMHERVARTLAADGGRGLLAAQSRTIALALHWDQAGLVEQALPALIEAAAVASASHAYGDAVALYRRCIERWYEQPDAAVSVEAELVMLHEYAAQAAYLADDTAAAIELVRQAIDLHDATADPVRAGILHQQLCEYLWQHGLEAESIETTRRAFDLVPADGSRERAIVVGAWASALSVLSRYEEALAVVEEAVRIGRRLDDPAATSWSLAVRGLCRCNLDDMAAGIADLAEARELARRSGDLDAQTIVYMDASWLVGVLNNDPIGALEIVAEWEELQARVGLERTRGMWMAGIAGALKVRMGAWTEAEEIMSAALRRPSRGPIRLELLYNAALLAIWQGRLVVGEELVAEALDVAGLMIGQQMIAPVHAAAMELALWRGAPGEAIALLDRARARLLEPDDPISTRQLYAVGMRAYADEVERLRGRRAVADEIRKLREQAAEVAAAVRYAGIPNGTVRQPETVAFAAQCDAELLRIDGDAGEAEAWRAVAACWAGLGLAYYEAYARWREAAAWLARDDRAAAADALERGHALAAAVGSGVMIDSLKSLARRARVRLAALDDHPATPSNGAPHGLTAREAEVLALVAKGMTNRQIAGELFISEKTAGVHVSNILAKLDVVSRAQAAAIAVQSGVGTRGT